MLNPSTNTLLCHSKLIHSTVMSRYQNLKSRRAQYPAREEKTRNLIVFNVLVIFSCVQRVTFLVGSFFRYILPHYFTMLIIIGHYLSATSQRSSPMPAPLFTMFGYSIWFRPFYFQFCFIFPPDPQSALTSTILEVLLVYFGCRSVITCSRDMTCPGLLIFLSFLKV